MKEVEKRVVRLEGLLGLRDEPETLEQMFAALERGDYGQTNFMAIVVSILSNGRSAEHLRGQEIPDILLDALVEHFRNSVANADGRGTDSL